MTSIIESATGSPAARASLWTATSFREPGRGPVEVHRLRDGMTLMLSQFGPEGAGAFHHVESEDVFGLGFHLRGGAQFDMAGVRFTTRPLDVWCGSAPRGAESHFSLPAQGFSTVSLRFAPEAARAFFEAHDAKCSPLADIAGLASSEVVATRLSSLDEMSALTVERMLNTSFAGSVRRLFLESTALTLLASNMVVRSPAETRGRKGHQDSIRRRLEKARALLDDRIADPPSIVSLAHLIGMNEFTLKREFKREFGTTVFGYVRQRRMEQAALDLHAGLSVADAAAAVGYECPRCFADAFRRHHGVLPSEVTRRVLPKLPRTAG